MPDPTILLGYTDLYTPGHRLTEIEVDDEGMFAEVPVLGDQHAPNQPYGVGKWTMRQRGYTEADSGLMAQIADRETDRDLLYCPGRTRGDHAEIIRGARLRNWSVQPPVEGISAVAGEYVLGPNGDVDHGLLVVRHDFDAAVTARTHIVDFGGAHHGSGATFYLWCTSPDLTMTGGAPHITGELLMSPTAGGSASTVHRPSDTTLWSQIRANPETGATYKAVRFTGPLYRYVWLQVTITGAVTAGHATFIAAIAPHA